MTVPSQEELIQKDVCFQRAYVRPRVIGRADGNHVPTLPPRDGYRDLWVGKGGLSRYVLLSIEDDQFEGLFFHCPLFLFFCQSKYSWKSQCCQQLSPKTIWNDTIFKWIYKYNLYTCLDIKLHKTMFPSRKTEDLIMDVSGTKGACCIGGGMWKHLRPLGNWLSADCWITSVRSLCSLAAPSIHFGFARAFRRLLVPNHVSQNLVRFNSSWIRATSLNFALHCVREVFFPTVTNCAVHLRLPASCNPGHHRL